ncbi:hypothetical protein RF11_00330 [Thelohanellus kitauei]|uniref:Uncharacterized protein n=1 Tax=Thelohanellus kitauei TaxID=669202 RepID=A0A0C2MAT8_THEKT|nr:hypothetical protein RF11_00330 [Thelohanellus kitauei]
MGIDIPKFPSIITAFDLQHEGAEFESKPTPEIVTLSTTENQNDGESVNDDVYASQSCSFGTNLDVKPATSSIKQEELVDSDLSKIDREVRLTVNKFEYVFRKQ